MRVAQRDTQKLLFPNTASGPTPARGTGASEHAVKGSHCLRHTGSGPRLETILLHEPGLHGLSFPLETKKMPVLSYQHPHVQAQGKDRGDAEKPSANIKKWSQTLLQLVYFGPFTFLVIIYYLD